MNGDSFLIDAGAHYHYYASDITRTYINPNTKSKAANMFAQLIEDLNKAQLELCKNVKPNLAYAQLQHQSHEKIAQIEGMPDNGIDPTRIQLVSDLFGNIPAGSICRGVTDSQDANQLPQ